MFGKSDMRYKLAVVWLIAFLGLWIGFKSILPYQTMKMQLDTIEQSIAKEDWKKAKEYTQRFKQTFIDKRSLIQMNNATEALTVFEHTIGQMEVTVEHKQESALEYVGALREALNLVIKPFSGP